MRLYDDNAGNWQGLGSSTQAPRYAAIAEILRGFNADHKVLDVGCGEAVLRDWLPNDTKYTGIELSQLAARIATERNISARIVHASAEDFDARGERFDSIVFSEMLYYTADPVWLLRKYAALLCGSGVILCSIYQKPGGVSLKRRLRYLFNRRRPLSNAQCADMVWTFMIDASWSILADRAVVIPGISSRWHIWAAKPAESHVESRGFRRFTKPDATAREVKQKKRIR